MAILKVSAHSRPTAVAGAIAGSIRENRYAEVQAIGADAVNQAIKAIAVARGYLQQDNLDIVCIPAFVDVVIDDQERTAIKIMIEARELKPGAAGAPGPTQGRAEPKGEAGTKSGT
jgi:stage V sporulation protein S